MSPLPLPIHRGLSQIEARLRMRSALRGLGTAIVVCAVLLLVSMAVDFTCPLPLWARTLIWAAGLAGLAGIVAFRVVWPLVQPMCLLDLAAVAERAHPQLAERLTCTVALMAGEEPAHGSPALISALADEAVAHGGGLDLARACSPWQAARGFAFSLALLGLLVLPALVRPDPFGFMLKRALVPWSDAGRVSRFVIEVQPGDRLVALGSELRVAATVRSRFGPADRTASGDAWLAWTDTRGKAYRMKMATVRTESQAPGTQRSYELRVPAVSASMHYRVDAGGTRSRLYAITAVEPPSVQSLHALIEPPAYTKLPPSSVRDATRLEVPAGSRVALSVTPHKPVQAAALVWHDNRDRSSTQTMQAAAGDPPQWTAALVASQSAEFGVQLRDEHGLTAGPEPLHHLSVRPDAPPTVAWTGHDEFNDARADDTLIAAIAARDDYAITLVEMHYAIDRGASSDESRETGQVTQLVPGLGTSRVRGEVRLALRPLDLKPGQAISYRVRAADNRPAELGGPQVAWTAARSLHIKAQAEPLLARRQAAAHKDLHAQLDAIKKAAAANRQETEQLRYAADAALRGNGRWDRERDEALAHREPAARDVINRLQLLARELEQRAGFQPLARPARQVAQVEAEAGRALLEQARRAADASERLATLQQADNRLASVQQRLDELQRQLEALARLDDDRQQLRALADRQEQLARQAEMLGQGPADRAQLDQVQAEQARLQQELEGLLKKSPALRADVLTGQAKEATALAERAHALADQQHDEARHTADLARSHPALKALAEAQRALEDDARRLATEIDAPLAENGRGRVNTELLTRAVPPLEHNDLTQARERLEQAENDLRRVGRELDDVRSDPKWLARRLARRQEALNGHANAVARDLQGAQLPAQRAELAERLKALVPRQQDIARLAAAIPAPEPQRDAARGASQATHRALEDLQATRTAELGPHLREAHETLNRLADALPDFSQRLAPARQKVSDARRRAEELARDLDRHLRETTPPPGKPVDARTTTLELGNRLAPLMARQDETVALLRSLQLEPRAQAQRDRAVRRAQALAGALQAMRSEAANLAGQRTGRPITTWHVLGPFAMGHKLPLRPDQSVNLNAAHADERGAEVAWRPATPDNAQGMINLGRIYSMGDRQAAYGYAEVESPGAGMGQLIVGSDDTLTVWLNGQQVYNFEGSRAYGPDQARLDVPLTEGNNRLLVRCGNTGGEWGFSVALVAPKQDKFDSDRVRILRQLLPVLHVEARAAIERLEQQLHGHAPADELAAELADDQRKLAEQLSGKDASEVDRNTALADQQRIATALRGLKLPEAPLAQSEAVRLAEAAARVLEKPNQAEAHQAVRDAARATEALAQSLADQLSLPARVDLLARAQRDLAREQAAGDSDDQARRQRTIANEVARLSMGDKAGTPGAVLETVALAEQAGHLQGTGAGHVQPTAAAVADARKRAAAALDELAAMLRKSSAKAADQELQGPPAPAAPDDPELGLKPRHVAAANDLAQRERRIREQLQTLLGERIGPQEQLRAESAALGRALSDLRERSHEFSPRSQGPASAAVQLLTQQAPQVMAEGEQQLAQGRADAAREAQRRAAGLLEHAGQQADDLATALLGDRPTEPGTEPPADSRLGQAHEAQRRASRELAQAHSAATKDTPAGTAAALMHAAATDLQAAAQPADVREGAEDGSPSLASQNGQPAKGKGQQPSRAGDPRGGPAGAAAADLSELQELVRRKTGRSWGELPGHLRTEILQMSQGRYREDYSRLIQLYFREIAAGETSRP